MGWNSRPAPLPTLLQCGLLKDATAENIRNWHLLDQEHPLPPPLELRVTPNAHN